FDHALSNLVLATDVFHAGDKIVIAEKPGINHAPHPTVPDTGFHTSVPLPFRAKTSALVRSGHCSTLGSIITMFCQLRMKYIHTGGSIQSGDKFDLACRRHINAYPGLPHDALLRVQMAALR